MLRRTMLKVLAAAPLAARNVGQIVEGNLVGAHGTLSPRSLSLGIASQDASNAVQDQPNNINSIPYDKLARYLKGNTQFIQELRDQISSEVCVTYIDHDLLAMRSLSQSARIYYMRQRLIERQLANQLNDQPYKSAHGVVSKWLDLARKALSV